MWDMMRTDPVHRSAIGYVYYHRAAADCARQTDRLYLYYEAADGTSSGTQARGREIVAVLTAVGLSVEWDGDPLKVIWVTLDWWGPDEW